MSLLRSAFLAFLASLLLSPGQGLAADDAPGSVRAAQLGDLELARSDYLAKEMAYSDAGRRQAAALIDRLERRAGMLTPAEMLVGLAQVGALNDNAHSGIRYHDPKAVPALRLPLRLLWFPDGMIVARATGTAASLVGARVERIEGLSIDEFYRRTKSLKGGKAVDRKKYLPELYESFGVLHALGLARAPDRLTLSLRAPDGRRFMRTVEMIPQDLTLDDGDYSNLWSPDPAVPGRGWSAALGTGDLPLYLQDAERPFRLVSLPTVRGLYIQFRSNEDEGDWKIAAFLQSVRDRIATQRPHNLIVDLRFDVGGNLTTTLSFMRGLPASVAGRTILLVGPYTFSAGIISAAAIKQVGGNKVRIVGDELGDRTHFWSEGGLVKLPNSHLGLRYTDGQFDLDHGCAGRPGCMEHLVDVNFVSLRPDMMAPLTLKAYLAKRDPGMEGVAALLRRPS